MDLFRLESWLEAFALGARRYVLLWFGAHPLFVQDQLTSWLGKLIFFIRFSSCRVKAACEHLGAHHLLPSDPKSTNLDPSFPSCCCVIFVCQIDAFLIRHLPLICGPSLWAQFLGSNSWCSLVLPGASWLLLASPGAPLPLESYKGVLAHGMRRSGGVKGSSLVTKSITCLFQDRYYSASFPLQNI